jgi:polar amino acid transport system substrate-binding protein
LNFSFAAGPIKPDDQIILASDEWCPYNCIPGSKKPGFMIEITRAALGLKGIDVIYKTMNWSRAHHKAGKGEIDGVIGVTTTEADEMNLAYGTEPLGLSYFAFIMHKDNDWKFAGPASLPDISFGIIQDYVNGEIIAEYLEQEPDNVTVQTGLNAFEKNMKLVMAGRLDAAIDDAAVAADKLQALGISDQTRIEALDEVPLPIFIAFKPGKEGEKLSRLLDEGVAELRRMGWLQDILAKYGQTDWKQDMATSCAPNCPKQAN